jgi:acyl-CoA reductase-like NAD-dependent aldehyde dehydrogenase
MESVQTIEHLIIDGQRTQASDAGTFEVCDPSSGGLLATVAKATKADVDRAVSAAQAALESKAWGGAAPAERGRILYRIAQALRDRAEELATLESRDNGKPLRQSRTDLQVAARYFEFFAGMADKIMGHTIPLAPGFLDYTVREPIGVSAQIIPWNYPIQIGARGVAPARR